jgi:flavin reductase (DIM6/NTAB) family NADH-FMN oxidoreductase RutF
MTMELSSSRQAAREAADLGEELRAAMREIAASVAVVTTGARAQALGATVTSVISVSLAPPMLAVSLNRQLRVSRAIREERRFRVSFLSDRDEDVARTFSGQTPARERFGVGEWDMDAAGGPLLRSALAGVLCRLIRIVPCGSHDLLLGLAEEVRTGAGAPLLYRRGCYD